MIYTPENTGLIGKPMRVLDADGVEIPTCTYADTETGEVRFYKTENGHPVVKDGELLREVAIAKLPLQLIPIG